MFVEPSTMSSWLCGILSRPASGSSGASVGSAVGAGAGFFFHFRFNRELTVRLSDCRPKGRIIGEIYRIGFPSILMMTIGSLTNYLMNRILHAYT
ncbi:MAG: hypothetical protein IKX41_06305, partial [Oscillospiraceae bacterium]|nr:hypothetical protein [Oscillospiraceae bacterium]